MSAEPDSVMVTLPVGCVASAKVTLSPAPPSVTAVVPPLCVTTRPGTTLPVKLWPILAEPDVFALVADQVKSSARVAGADEVQRTADRFRAVLCDADVGAGQPIRRPADRGEAALVADELHDLAERIDQRDAVRRAVLQARRRHRREPVAAGLAGEHAVSAMVA